MTSTTVEKLFEPGRIGSLELKNRLIMPPMLMGYCSEDGYVTERAKDYYEARAEGGVGMVIVESAMPQPAGKMFRYYLDCSDDKFLPGLSELAEVIKRHGARAALQLGDGGREVRFDMTGKHPVGPSPIAARKREVPREMTTSEVRETIASFARAVLRAKQAGFEGVEIHGAHVYLVAQFLSGSTNVRSDEYGGNTRNRARFVTELVQEARELVGDEFPIWLRLNGVEDDTPGGLTVEESAAIARLAQEAGYDAISVSAGSPHYDSSIQSMYLPRGMLLPVAAAIKQAVDVPVIAVGRLTAELGNQALVRGDADFIAIGRGLMVDPELPRKAQEGRLDEIAPCIGGLNCVHRGVLRDTPITCTVNAALGRERELALLPAPRAKTVAVIGSGPAGLEAARVAAHRGHSVTLFERDGEVGGQLRLRGSAPHKGTLGDLTNYLTGQLKKEGVSIRVGDEANAAAISALRPDAVVVAGGTAGCRWDREHEAGVTTIDDVLGGERIRNTDVVIVGGDTRCCEGADLLSEAGNSVTIVTSARRVAPEAVGLIRRVLLQNLADKQVTMLTDTQLGAITATGIEVVGKDGVREELKAGLVVFGGDVALDLDLVGSLRGLVGEVFLAGDCLKAGEIQDAIFDGHRVGRLL